MLRKTDNSKRWWGCGEVGASRIPGGGVRCHRYCGKTGGGSSGSPTPPCHPRRAPRRNERTRPHETLNVNVCSSLLLLERAKGRRRPRRMHKADEEAPRKRNQVSFTLRMSPGIHRSHRSPSVTTGPVLCGSGCQARPEEASTETER